MEVLFQGIREALRLLFTLDREVLTITLLSLKVSGIATLLSVGLGMGGGTVVALTDFPGKRLLVRS